MSALSVVFGWGGGIFMAGDGLAYDDEGIPRVFCQKIRIFSNLNCIVGVIGIGDYLNRMETKVINGGYTSFDELLEYLPNLCRQAVEEHIEEWEHPSAHGTLVVAGWSEQRQAYEAFKVHSHPKPVHNAETGEVEEIAPAWTLIEINSVWCSNIVSPEELEAIGVPMGEDYQPHNLAVGIICAARGHSGPKEPQEPEEGIPQHPSQTSSGYYAVGGFVQLVYLRRDAIASWIVHRWPDRLFEHIDPKASDLAPPFPIKLEM